MKARNWFFKQCLYEERRITKLAYLSKKALDLGLSNMHNTEGQILQACGATQKFLADFPDFKRVIKKSSPTEPFQLKNGILEAWKTYLSQNSGYTYQRFNYNFSTLITYLTPQYGGHCSGGGGGDHEFKVVLRLMAEFIDRE